MPELDHDSPTVEATVSRMMWPWMEGLLALIVVVTAAWGVMEGSWRTVGSAAFLGGVTFLSHAVMISQFDRRWPGHIAQVRAARRTARQQHRPLQR